MHDCVISWRVCVPAQQTSIWWRQLFSNCHLSPSQQQQPSSCPRPTESETLKVGLATCTLIIPKWLLFMLTFENSWFWARGVGVWFFKIVPSVTIFWGSKDDSHLKFGDKGTLKIMWHPSEHLRADCWWLPAYTPFPCAESSKGAFLPPHPQVTHRCVPFLHGKLKERERNTGWYRAFHPGAYGLKGKIEPGGYPIREALTFWSDHKNQQTTKGHHTFVFFALSGNTLPTS